MFYIKLLISAILFLDLRPFLMNSSVAPFLCALPNGPPRYSLGGFFSSCLAVVIHKNRKLDASYVTLRVDKTVSDVISTLRTRTM